MHPIKGTSTHIRALLILLLALLPLTAMAQQPPEAAYPYRRDIEKYKFERTEQKLFRHLRRDSNNLEWHYSAYQLYSTPAYPRYNTDSAYHHLVLARRLYDRAEPKTIERLERDSYSGALFDFSFRRLASMALADAHTHNTPDAYRHFLQVYLLAPDDILDSAVRFRDSAEYRIALIADTRQSLDDFITQHPTSHLISQAVHRRDSIAFAEVDRTHTASAYAQFCSAYPNSHLYGRATDSLYLLDFRSVRRLDAEQHYRSYADRYPLSPYTAQALWLADSIQYLRLVDTAEWFSLVQYADLHPAGAWGDTALHALARYALRHRHVQAASLAADRLAPGTALRAQIALLLHHAYLHTSIRNFHRFYRRFPDLMTPDTRHRDSLAYLCNQNYDFRHADSCIRAVAPSHDALIMLQQLLKDDIDHGRLHAASLTVKQYAQAFGYDYDYLQLLANLSPDSSPLKGLASELASKAPQPLPGHVNTPRGDEYAPVPTADGRTLYFAAKNRPENLGGEDIFVARRTKNGWAEPQLEIDLSHTYGNEAPLSVSADGQTLLLYQTGLLYRADRTAEGWNIAPLSPSLPGSHRLVDASLAAGGRVLLLTTMSRTPREVDSSLNIYVSFLTDSGQWTSPVELGPTVNTPFDERSPYLHPDMRTLYFSSEGHGSLGQMDLFVTTRLDDTYTRWSTPVGVAPPINTSGDDWGHTVTPNGKHCYLSRRGASQDIYTLPVPSHARPEPVVAVSGSVKDPAGRPVAVRLRWQDPVSGNTLGWSSTHPVQGTFYHLLPLGSQYTLLIDDPRYLPDAHPVDLTPAAPSTRSPITVNLIAVPSDSQ